MSSKKTIKEPEQRAGLKEITSLLKTDLRLDDDWDKFSIHFDQVHQNFFKRLKQKYPQLSKSDYQLGSYLRMNLTTKEIAPLLNISIRGVEIRRYRLRKKLGLDSKQNLNEFMLQF